MTHTCTICGDEIHGGTMIGDGDGTGQRFAHRACYYLRELIHITRPYAPLGVQLKQEEEARRLSLRVFAP